MIIILIGTKGQYIKMAPILLELENRGYDYLFINAKQHVHSLDKMIKAFGTKKPDFEMWNFGKDITNIKEIITWLGVNTLRYSLGIQRKIFPKKNRHLLLVHGDAPPVLLGLILAKFHKIDLAHIEAGFRTNNIFAPFPEEIIRIIADKTCKYLFSMSNFASRNLFGKYHKKGIFYLEHNTLFDAMKIALTKDTKPLIDPYVLVSLHRFETIQSRSKMKMIIEMLIHIAKEERILFPMHESTKKAFVKFDLYKEISTIDSITMTPLLDYFSFINYIKKAKYIITDGGGPQEESFLLGTPCLILRETTERIWRNNCLAGFDENKVKIFLKNPEKYRTKMIISEYSPSKKIVDFLEKLDYLK